jgi:hypothetical protein
MATWTLGFAVQQLIMAILWLWALRMAYLTGKDLWKGMRKEKKDEKTA